jgi:hypothetical protein
MAKPIRNYILLVDAHRRPSRTRNTSGRYRVGAKTEKEAIELLRDKIKFGSIQCYYECSNDGYTIEYKKVVKEEFDTTGNKPHFRHVEVKSAIDPQQIVEDTRKATYKELKENNFWEECDE